MDHNQSQRKPDEAARFAWYDELGPNRQDKTVGPAVERAHTRLWRELGGRPGYLTVTPQWLAAEFGADARTARGWLESMKERGLIDVIERDTNRGTLHLYVYASPEEVRRVAPDPQGTLAGFGDEEPVPPRDAPPQMPETVPFPRANAPDSAGLSAQKPPGVSAQEPPRENAKAPEKRGFDDESSGFSAQNPPRPSMDTIERQDSILPSSHRTTRFHGIHGGDAPADDDSKMLLGFATAEAMNNFAAASSPAHQKAKLVEEINATLQDPATHPSVVGRAADLVVNGDVDYSELRCVLTDITEIRRAHHAGRGQGFKRSAGAFFHSKVREWPGWKVPKTQRTP